MLRQNGSRSNLAQPWRVRRQPLHRLAIGIFGSGRDLRFQLKIISRLILILLAIDDALINFLDRCHAALDMGDKPPLGWAA